MTEVIQSSYQKKGQRSLSFAYPEMFTLSSPSYRTDESDIGTRLAAEFWISFSWKVISLFAIDLCFSPQAVILAYAKQYAYNFPTSNGPISFEKTKGALFSKINYSSISGNSGGFQQN